MLSNLRHLLRKRLLQAGYQVDCIRSIPHQLLDSTFVRKLEFADVAYRRMIEAGRTLTFVQVGVYDGVTNDPLYPYIVDHGWTGLLIEPQSEACQRLRDLHRNRPGIRVVQAAIHDHDGEMNLFRVQMNSDLPAWCGGLASFSRESIEKHESLAPGVSNAIVEETVQTRTFRTLLSESGSNGVPDILQIDTEGFDAQILNWFPFDEMAPPIVQFERKHLDVPTQEACLDRLTTFGYRFAPSGGEDLLAVL